MKNILLTLDNSVEFDFTRTILSKLGFNVLSKKKGTDMHSLFQTSFPDLVITSVLGSGPDALKDFVDVRSKKGMPKFIWVGADSRLKKLHEDQKKLIDCSLSSPVQPEKLIRAICELTGLDKEEYMQKYHSLYSKEGGEPAKKAPITNDEERRKRYEEVVANVEAQDRVFSLKDMKAHNDESAGQLNTDDLLEQKRKFVKTLMGED